MRDNVLIALVLWPFTQQLGLFPEPAVATHTRFTVPLAKSEIANAEAEKRDAEQVVEPMVAPMPKAKSKTGFQALLCDASCLQWQVSFAKPLLEDIDLAAIRRELLASLLGGLLVSRVVCLTFLAHLTATSVSFSK